MEKELKLLQKNFKNKEVPYIFLKCGKLYATDMCNLGVYRVDNQDTKVFDINTLEEIPLEKFNKEFPDISENNVDMIISRDVITLNRKQLLLALTELKQYVKDNAEEIFEKDLCDVIVEDNMLHFQVTTQDKSFGDYHFKRFSLKLERQHVNYTRFHDIYSWKIILKYLKSCKSDVITIKYNGECMGSPLVFEDNVIYKFYTAPFSKK